MSIGPLGLPGSDKGPVPAGGRFPSTLPLVSTRFPSMDARLIATRLPSLAMYGSAYATPNFPSYLPYGPTTAAAVAAAADPSAFYSSLTPGENVDAWRAGLTQAAAAYYDPAAMAHYGYGYGPIGLNDGARRKNATRETTATLKAWLNEHRKNPYPTKGEKIMLAIITKMTLTQVSTWFANARRRLKKENKMTWSPRNRCGEDDDDDEDDLAEEGQHSNEHPSSRTSSPITPGDPPPNGLLLHSSDRKILNGHHSGGEGNSDEVTCFSDIRGGMRTQFKNENTTNEKKEENITSVPVMRQNSSEDHRMRFSSQLARQHAHSYAHPRSSPSLGGLPTNFLPSSMTRSTIPFPPSVGNISGVPPHSNMLHPGVTGQLNHAAAASLLAATRGHPLSPHLFAAFNEQQLQYQQALQALPANPLLGVSSEASKPSSNAAPSGNEASPSPKMSCNTSSSSPTTSKSPLRSTSPNKPKIWSIADVATSEDTTKSILKSKHEKSPSLECNKSNTKDRFNIPNCWLDPHLAAAISNQCNLTGGLTPQLIQQLASVGLQHNGSGSALAQNTIPQQFAGLANMLAAQEKSNAAFREMEKNAYASNHNQDLAERASLSSDNHSPDTKGLNSENLSTNRFVPSPSGSYQGATLSETNDTK